MREAAGERFAAIELNHGVAHVIVTENRKQAAEERARKRAATGVTPDQVLDDPYLLIGTVEHIVETLQRRREHYGISYLHVFWDEMDMFAPVVARLAGT